MVFCFNSKFLLARFNHLENPCQLMTTCKTCRSKNAPEINNSDEGSPFHKKDRVCKSHCNLFEMSSFVCGGFPTHLDPNRLHISLSPNNSEPFPAPNPQLLAFMIICQMTISHLANGVADNVVIDSSLPRSQLDMLIQVATGSPDIRVVVIECKPKNTYMWKRLFEKHINIFKDNSNWYKAKNWDDISDAIQNDEDDSSSYGPGVSKLVLDPLTDNMYTNGIPLYVASKPSSFEPPLFMEAVRYMMTRNEEDSEGPFIVMYHDRHSFTPYKEDIITAVTDSQKMENRKLWCLSKGHHISSYSEEVGNGEDEAKCMACNVGLNGGGIYSCINCRSALHKECAESFDEANKLFEKPCPSAIHPWSRLPVMFACASCKKDNKPFSRNCAPCLFETNMRCCLLPLVIRHDCDEEHFLSLVLLPSDAVQEIFLCVACGKFARDVLYTCRICNKHYHFSCLNEIPSRVKHEHGLHHHRMQLRFSSEEAEDYLCQECQDLRNPDEWFYSCQDCNYETHLGCILMKIQGEYSWKWNIPADICL